MEEIKIGDKVEYTKETLPESFANKKQERVIGKVIWIEPVNQKTPYRKVKVDSTITTTKDIKLIIDVRQEVKNLDNNITNVVSREDGTLEVYLKKQSSETKTKVLTLINQMSLNACFTKIDFHEVGVQL